MGLFVIAHNTMYKFRNRIVNYGNKTDNNSMKKYRYEKNDRSKCYAIIGMGRRDD